MAIATQGGSRWRCFPVGLRPPSQHLHREGTDTNIIKQYLNEQIYSEYIFKPYGTKIGAQATNQFLKLTAMVKKTSLSLDMSMSRSSPSYGGL
jgi:hypothetical protein